MLHILTQYKTVRDRLFHETVSAVPLVAVSGTNSNVGTYFNASTRAWTSTTLPSLGNWKSCAYGNGRWVAVKRGSDKCAYTLNGTDWVEATLPESRNWNSVAFGAGLFVAVYQLGTASTVATSPDGITWTARAITTTSTDNSGHVAFSGVKFVIAASIYFLISSDGITWTKHDTGAAATLSTIAFCRTLNKFVVCTASSPIYRMTDTGTYTTLVDTNSGSPGPTPNAVCASSVKVFTTFSEGIGQGASLWGASDNADDWVFADGMGTNENKVNCFAGAEFVAIGTTKSFHSADLLTFEEINTSAGNVWQGIAAAKELPW